MREFFSKYGLGLLLLAIYLLHLYLLGFFAFVMMDLPRDSIVIVFVMLIAALFWFFIYIGIEKLSELRKKRKYRKEMEKNFQENKAKKADNKQTRLCKSCGKNPPPIGHSICRECEDAHDERLRNNFDDGF